MFLRVVIVHCEFYTCCLFCIFVLCKIPVNDCVYKMFVLFYVVNFGVCKIILDQYKIL